MRFASLGSGSKGNSTLVQAGGTSVMIDCGFSLRGTLARLDRLGVDPQSIDAVLVTHEHSDHSSGVAALSRKFEVPIYLTHGTRATGRVDGGHSYHCFNCEDVLTIGELTIKAVAVPHDAAEPCQFRLQWKNSILGVLTDLGSITPHVIENFRECGALLLEFNHDLSMLLDGPYPPHLKRRVGGDWGHLNNTQAADLLRQVNSSSLAHVVVAHISEKNNSRESAERALLSALDTLDNVVFAEQSTGCDWLQIS
jgi:phosphoribosyl 1,2-cyclic phosphodiesterase